MEPRGDDFLRLHRALEVPGTRLQRDQQVAEWLRRVVVGFAAVPVPRTSVLPGDLKAFRLACDYLGDRLASNVGLDELAAAAGIGKFRLIRLFRERTGLPPHATQVAHRIRAARRHLEAGRTIAETVAATGFADQSHFHRIFQRSLGLTPGEYQRRIRAGSTISLPMRATSSPPKLSGEPIGAPPPSTMPPSSPTRSGTGR